MMTLEQINAIILYASAVQTWLSRPASVMWDQTYEQNLARLHSMASSRGAGYLTLTYSNALKLADPAKLVEYSPPVVETKAVGAESHVT